MAGALVIAGLIAELTLPAPLLVQETEPLPPSSQVLDEPGETTTIGPDAPSPAPPTVRTSDWVRRFYGPLLSVAPEIVGGEFQERQGAEETGP